MLQMFVLILYSINYYYYHTKFKYKILVLFRSQEIVLYFLVKWVWLNFGLSNIDDYMQIYIDLTI